MREMKDSGIEWIGEIPEDWEIVRNKNAFNCAKTIIGDNWVNNQLLSLTTKGVIEKSFDDLSGKVPESFSTYQTVKVDDIIMCLFDLDCSAVFSGISKYNGIISPAYKILNCKSNIVPLFADFWFQFIFQKRKFKTYAKNLRYTLNYDEFAILPIILPSLYEQQKISAYLDRKCAEIDSVISKTKATIEEYKKLKQSVITQAVTKGIIPNRPMKDSGIEWIGEIPQEWKLIPFRYVLKERNEKNSPIKSYERLSLSIDLGVTTYSEKTTNLDRFKEDFEQYKLAHIGDLVMNSMNMIVGATGVSDYYGCVSPVYYTFYDETENHITAKFCEYIFRSKAMLRVLYSLGKGIYAIVRGDDRVNTCRLKVAKEDLKSLKIPLPTAQEQQEIVNYLNEKCSEIDKLIAKKEQLLTEMENYKKAVIYEYVTGKKEV